MAAGVRAGKAFVEIHGDNNPLSRALAAAGQKLKSWGASVTKMGLTVAAAGSAALTPLLAAARGFAKAGDEIDKISKRLGASAEFVSALGYAAQLGGTDIAAMETGIRRLQRSAMDAANGSKTASMAFGRLGIDVKDAGGELKTTEALFMETAAGLAAMTNNTEKAALASMLFGRAGTSLLPMLSEGEKGLIAAMEEAKHLAQVMTDEDVKAAAGLTDAWTRLSKVTTRLWTQVGGALAPALTKLFNGLAPILTTAIEWTRVNSTLITSVAAVAAGTVAAGAGLVAIGMTLSAAGTVATTLAAALGLVKVALLFIASPIGLVVAGLAGLVAYATYSAGGIRAVFQNLMTALAPLTEIFTASLQGIKDALTAGDFQLAAKVLWSSLKVAWLEGVKGLTAMWIDFKHDTMKVWNDVTTCIESVWLDFTNQMRWQWLDLTNTMMGALESVSRKAMKTMTWVMAKVRGKDTAKALAFVDYSFDSATGKREAAYLASMNELAEKREAAAKALTEASEGTAGVIEDMRGEAHRAAARELAEARAEWETAMGEARTAAGNATPWGDPFAGLSPASDHGPDIDPQSWSGQASVRGTFYAAAVAGLTTGSGDEAKRTATATEDSAKTLKSILQKIGVPLFE